MKYKVGDRVVVKPERMEGEYGHVFEPYKDKVAVVMDSMIDKSISGVHIYTVKFMQSVEYPPHRVRYGDLDVQQFGEGNLDKFEDVNPIKYIKRHEF